MDSLCSKHLGFTKQGGTTCATLIFLMPRSEIRLTHGWGRGDALLQGAKDRKHCGGPAESDKGNKGQLEKGRGEKNHHAGGVKDSAHHRLEIAT